MRSKVTKDRDIEATTPLNGEEHEKWDGITLSSPRFAAANQVRRRKVMLWPFVGAIFFLWCLCILFFYPVRTGWQVMTISRPSNIVVQKHQPVPLNETSCPEGVACFWKAPALSPTALLTSDAHLTWNKSGSVPRLLHQSWGDKPINSRVKAWSDKCRMLHPEWQWVLWRNDDNRRLVQDRFPWLLESFDALDSNIKRADAARNLYMYEFGGVYLDFDIECVQPFDNLFEESPSDNSKHSLQAFFGRMGKDREFEHSIPNDWMASSAKHPFFLLPIQIIYQTNKHNSLGPEAETGPVALRNEILSYEKLYADDQSRLDQYLESLNIQYQPQYAAEGRKASITLLDEHMIHPFDWWKGYKTLPGGQADKCLGFKNAFDPESCKELLQVNVQGSYAVAYWTHSWDSKIHE